MIDYNSDVLPLEQGGMDDAAIASFLSAKTRKDILASELENFLSKESLAKRNAITGAWEGVLIDTMNEGGEIGEGLDELFSHLNKPRSVVVETSKTPWAEKASLLVSGLFVSAKLTELQVSGIYGLAGGKAHNQGVAVDEVVAARADAQQKEAEKQAADQAAVAEANRIGELRSLLSRIETEFINSAANGGGTASEAIEAIKQGL